MRLYHIWALTKIVIGAVVALVVYHSIDVTQDPAVGIGFGLVSLLLIAWGCSFYFFLGVNKLLASKNTYELASDSYKMSLLFGLFCLLHVVLLLMGIWTKLLGAILVVGFLLLYMLLFMQPATSQRDW